MAGGHTIRSEEPIFGLAVQGLVHPDRILTKRGAQPGDAVVLSKPLGTGIVLAGATPDDKAVVTSGMRRLNRAAAEAFEQLGSAVHAVTDVTGFGLLGHSWEMAERSGVRLRLEGARLPLYPGASEAAAAGTRTGGDSRNRHYLAGKVELGSGAVLEAIAFDPQTSGGLLAAVDPGVVPDLVAQGFWEIGEVCEGKPTVELR